MTDNQKKQISQSIKSKIKKEGLSLRKVSFMVDDLSYPQIHRITSGKNYTLDTLLKVLDPLGLEIKIVEKESEEQD